MSDDLYNVTLEAIEKRGADLWVKISGVEYHVLGYVEPYVSRRKIGESVDISYGVSSNGAHKALTKIVQHKGDGKPESAPAGSKAAGKPTAKDITVTLRKIDHPYLIVNKDGEEKITLYCLSRSMHDMIAGDSDLHIPQRVTVTVDAQSFVVGYKLGEAVPEDGLPAIKTADRVKESPKKPEPPAVKENVAPEPPATVKESLPVQEPPMKEEPIPAKEDNTCTSPHTFNGKLVLKIGGTCNLEQFENLKIDLEGTVDPNAPGEREALIRYWDDTLALFGKNHPVTKDKIDSFRKRVIMGALS